MSEPRNGLSALSMALIASLIVNALLIGLVAGGALGKKGERSHGHRGGADFQMARELETIVPEGNRGEIRQAFREAFVQSRGQWREKREARRAMMTALSAEPFEPQSLEDAFARMREADTALTRNFQTTLVEQIARLSDSERAELVAWLETVERERRERRERRGERRGERGDQPPPSRD